MFKYNLTYKTVPDGAVYLKQLRAINDNIQTVNYYIDDLALNITSSIEIDENELVTLDAIVPASTPAQHIVERTIHDAIKFGQRMVVVFAAENVILGITQAGKTTAVRKATADVVSALNTGSLYDAMAECRLIPAEDKDSVFVTDARLLNFINKIETYLGLSLSAEL